MALKVVEADAVVEAAARAEMANVVARVGVLGPLAAAQTTALRHE